MPKDKDLNKISQGIQILSKKFLANLDKDLNGFEKFFDKIRSKKVKNKEAQECRDKMHKISGSAKMFGFAKIGELASSVERVLDGYLEGGDEEDLLKMGADYEEFLSLAKKELGKGGGAKKSKKEKKEEKVEKKEKKKRSAKDIEYRILLAEDNEIVNELVVKTLERKGYFINSTADGQEALEVLRSKDCNFNLMLLDVNMPKKNGLEVLKVIKSEGLTNAPVVMLTKKDEDQDIIDAMSLGASDYIVKPFKPVELRKRVDDILKNETKTILVADDDELVLGIVVPYLKQSGYHVLSAKDGKEALKIAKKNRIDLFLLDYMMPKLDGISTIKNIKKDDSLKDAAIIMLSNKGQKSNVLLGLKSGADDYITKPFDLEEVATRIDLILNKKGQ